MNNSLKTEDFERASACERLETYLHFKKFQDVVNRFYWFIDLNRTVYAVTANNGGFFVHTVQVRARYGRG